MEVVSGARIGRLRRLGFLLTTVLFVHILSPLLFINFVHIFVSEIAKESEIRFAVEGLQRQLITANTSLQEFQQRALSAEVNFSLIPSISGLCKRRKCWTYYNLCNITGYLGRIGAIGATAAGHYASAAA